MYQIIIFYTLNFHKDICQLWLNKARIKELDTVRETDIYVTTEIMACSSFILVYLFTECIHSLSTCEKDLKQLKNKYIGRMENQDQSRKDNIILICKGEKE